MGLDITAYSRLKHVGKHSPEPWCEDETHVQAFAYDTFPQSFRGIPILNTRSVNGETFLEGGCYQFTDETATLDFQAGSYNSYGFWRDDLSGSSTRSASPTCRSTS